MAAPTTPLVLSKTNFLIYRDCAHNAWVQMHCPEIYRAKPLSAFDQNIIETGRPRTNIRVTRGHFTQPRHCTMATCGSSTPATGRHAALQRATCDRNFMQPCEFCFCQLRTFADEIDVIVCTKSDSLSEACVRGE